MSRLMDTMDSLTNRHMFGFPQSEMYLMPPTESQGSTTTLMPLGGNNRPAVDLIEKENEFVVNVDMPGVTKDNVKLHIDNQNVLHVSTEFQKENKEDQEQQGWIIHKRERFEGMYERHIRLPNNVDKNQISASVDNGVLTIDIPKTEPAGLKQMINVTEGGKKKKMTHERGGANKSSSSNTSSGTSNTHAKEGTGGHKNKETSMNAESTS